MRHPTPQPTPSRRAALSAGVLFSALAALVLGLVMSVEVWRGLEQRRLLEQLSLAQQNTLPAAMRSQRLVRNLETVRLEGERLLAQPAPGQRTPSMYVIDVIVESPGGQEDSHVGPALRRAQQLLRELAPQVPLAESDQRRWAATSLELAQLADQVAAEAIERLDGEVARMRRSVDRGLWQLGVSVVVLTASLLAFVLALYASLIRPLRHVSATLAAIQRGDVGARPASPRTWRTREIGDIHQAMRQLDRLMRENEAIRTDLQASANTDSLTGLYNRRHFMEEAGLSFARARRSQSPLTLAIADLDHFKAVDDSLGHAAGDQVLRAVAQRIRAALRQTDIYCRYGGEEFAFVFPDTGLAEAEVLANRLREAIAATAIPVGDGRQVSISISLGLVEVHDQALDTAVNQADQAMYRAKVAGRNRVESASELQPAGLT